MSIKSFLAKLWKNVQSLFNGFPSDIRSAIHTGVSITNNIKKIVDSPLVDILTAIIPGNLDDNIKLILRAQIPVLLTNLKLVDDCNNSTDPQEITRYAITAMQNLQGEIKNAYLHSLSVMIAQLAADGKLSWSDGVYIVEWYYQNKFKQNI